jgi:uncharacterized membrane protein
MTTGTPGRPGRAVKRLTLAGVVTSAALLAAGLASRLAGVDSATSRWLLDAGVLCLMTTPVIRVAVAIGEFAEDRDWRFVAVSLVVLAILAGTLGVALAGR